MKKTRKQKRVFSVTGGQIWFALIVAAIGMIVAFEVGVSVGKKRVINAERESMLQDDGRVNAATKLSSELKLPRRFPPGQSTELSEADEEAVEYTVQVGTFRSRQGAEDLVKLLESYEYRSWLRTEPETETTSLHSVLVGRFDTRDEAERYGRAMVKSLFYINSYMVREISE